MHRRNAPHRLALLAVVLALAAACGGPSSSGGGGENPPLSCAAVDEVCFSPDECCSGICSSYQCACSGAPNAPCATSAACCSGQVCGGSHTCIAGDRPIGDYCVYDYDCLSGRCTVEGVCGGACAGYGGSCTAADDCCDLLGCPGGSPATPATCSYSCIHNDYEPCTADDQCCSGSECRAGYCQLGTCSTSGGACDGDADCCSTTNPRFHCGASGRCECGTPGSASVPAGGCVDDADCCTGFDCRDGLCHEPASSVNDGAQCIDFTDCSSQTCLKPFPNNLTGRCCSGQDVPCGTGIQCCNQWPTPSLLCLAVTGACGDCRPVGGACAANDDCCKRNCKGTACCEPQPLTCATDAECCSGHCGTLDSDGTGPKCCEGVGGACGGFAGECCDGLECDISGTDTCKSRPGGACNGDADCYMGTCNLGTGICEGELFAPCAGGMPCVAGLACGDTGTCQVVPGGLCASAFVCLNYDYSYSPVACLEGACCLVPDEPSARCTGSGGTDGGQCCSGDCNGGACSCSGPLAPCEYAQDCCTANACVLLDPADTVTRCCAQVGETGCRAKTDCCEGRPSSSYRTANIDCPAAGPVAQTCCVTSGGICYEGEPCCAGTICQGKGASSQGTCP